MELLRRDCGFRRAGRLFPPIGGHGVILKARTPTARWRKTGKRPDRNRRRSIRNYGSGRCPIADLYHEPRRFIPAILIMTAAVAAASPVIMRTADFIPNAWTYALEDALISA